MHPDRLMMYPTARKPPVTYRMYECVLHPSPQNYQQSIFDLEWVPKTYTREWATSKAEENTTWEEWNGERFADNAVSWLRIHLCDDVPWDDCSRIFMSINLLTVLIVYGIGKDR